MDEIAVLGGGSWGTALSLVAASSGARVRVWAREPEVVASVVNGRENRLFLPGFSLPETVHFTMNLEEVLQEARVVLCVIPSQYCRSVLESITPFVHEKMIFVSATKGIETATLMRVSGVIEEVISRRFRPRIAVLSGPSFAREVAESLPTAVTAASGNADTAKAVQASLSTSAFRVYTTSDVVGVELGGALKNIVAIAAGIVEGLGLGSNTMAALLTRGLAEIVRLGVAMGGRAETLSGLSGMGDLVLTCTGALSRNRKVGIEIGAGKTLEEATANMRMVAEGINTTLAAMSLSDKYGIDMPITRQVYEILYNAKDPARAVQELMTRSLKPEF